MKDWNRQIGNDDGLFDGLDGCDLVDNSMEGASSEKNGDIPIEFADSSETTDTASENNDFLEIKSFEDDKKEFPKFIKPIIEDYDELTYTQEEEKSSDDEYKYIPNYKSIETSNEEINPQIETEFDHEKAKKDEQMKEQNQWGEELGQKDEIERKDLGDLNEFPTAEHKNEEEEEDDTSIEIDSDDEVVDIPIADPELSITEDNVDVDIVKPKDFNELISSQGEVLDNYISGNAKFANISENLHVCIELCKLFASIHSLGYCFNGITAKDILVTPKKECKLISDAKIVSPDDDTYEVMYVKTCAPEVLRKEARPSINTDKHSMAFLIFGMLFKSDPFEGSKSLNTPCYTREDELKIYQNPVFVYSYIDKSNLPVYGMHSVLIKYWNKYYPADIKMIFQQNFVAGVEDAESRTEDETFIEKLTLFKAKVDGKHTKPDSVDTAKKPQPDDGSKNPIKEPSDTKSEENKPTPTVEGNPPAKYQLHIKFAVVDAENSDSTSLDLTPGVEIQNKIVGYEDVEGDKVIGRVIQNAKRKDLLGIKNMSNCNWVATKGSSSKIFAPGKVLVISNGVIIDFDPLNTSKTKNQWSIREA